MMRIGWIGLGAMGLGMARCAARAGHHVVGHSRGRPQHIALEADGGELSADLSSVVTGATMVCINVFSDDQVRSVLYDDAVLPRLAPGAMLVIHTTGDPALSRQVARDAPSGVAVIDASFSGSPAQAAAGELTMMVGGGDESFARARPVLECYASHVSHVGPTGAAMQLKLINNLLFAAHVSLAAAAYRIAEQDGIAAETVADLLGRCSGASRALSILGRTGNVTEHLDNMRIYVEKDVATALASANAAGLDLGLLGEAVREFTADSPRP